MLSVKDQSAATIAMLLVEQISIHGVPTEILSDRGKAFLSELFKEVEKFLGFHTVNTTDYYSQKDALVKRFNRTLMVMLAKTTEREDEIRITVYLMYYLDTGLLSNSPPWSCHFSGIWK